ETHSDHTCIINFSRAHSFFLTSRCRSGFKTSTLRLTEVSTSSQNRVAIFFQSPRDRRAWRVATRPTPLFISTAEFAPAGIGALVPVGSGPAPSHKTPEPQMSCRACGTYLRGRNAPGNNLPSRLVFLNNVPTPRRYAPDRPLDHRAWQWPRHDLVAQPAKAEFVPIGRKAQQSAASRSERPIRTPRERPQSQPAVCRNRSGWTSAGAFHDTPGLSPAMPLPPRSAACSRARGLDSPAKS